MLEDMVITRRKLLKVGGAAGAVFMVPGVAHAGSTPTTKNSWLERGTFNSRVGQRFGMATAAGGSVTLTLDAVLDLVGENRRGQALAGRNDAFALSFKGPAGVAAFQQTRLFTHVSLGQHPLFVVAGTGTEGGLVCLVVVNRSA